MKPIPIKTIEEEDGLLYNVIRVNIKSTEIYEAKEFINSIDLCKVIFKMDNIITRTHYFKNGIETSREKILQDERLKQIRK
jgi:hypothetical protein